jgi:FkbM family methyltransferase
MLLVPGGLRALRRQRPLSLSAFALTSRLARLGLRPATLLDVGANKGQFTAAALSRWPDIEVQAFEPLPDEAARLVTRFGPLPNDRVHRTAIGDVDGTTVIHRHAYSLSSSLMPTTRHAREHFEWAAVAAVVETPIQRLDALLTGSELRAPVLLKIDVQGSELKVLAGARALLPAIDAILVEQSFEPFYEGQPLFPEVHQVLAEAGWTLARVMDLRNEDGVPVEADCLYVPTGTPGPTMAGP